MKSGRLWAPMKANSSGWMSPMRTAQAAPRDAAHGDLSTNAAMVYGIGDARMREAIFPQDAHAYYGDAYNTEVRGVRV